MTALALSLLAVLLNALCYRWGYKAGAEAMGRMEFARGLRVGWQSRPAREITDGPLVRATAEEINAHFGPRGVVRP